MNEERILALNELISAKVNLLARNLIDYRLICVCVLPVRVSSTIPAGFLYKQRKVKITLDCLVIS